MAAKKTPKKLPPLPIAEFRELSKEGTYGSDKYGVLEVIHEVDEPECRVEMDWGALTTRHAFEPLDVPIMFQGPIGVSVPPRSQEGFRKVVVPKRTNYRHWGPIDPAHAVLVHHTDRRDSYWRPFGWWRPAKKLESIFGAVRCQGGFLTVEIRVDPECLGAINFICFFPYKLPDVGLAGSLDQKICVPPV